MQVFNCIFKFNGLINVFALSLTKIRRLQIRVSLLLKQLLLPELIKFCYAGCVIPFQYLTPQLTSARYVVNHKIDMNTSIGHNFLLSELQVLQVILSFRILLETILRWYIILHASFPLDDWMNDYYLKNVYVQLYNVYWVQIKSSGERCISTFVFTYLRAKSRNQLRKD